MDRWSFLTNHARVLLRIAREPGPRLRDIAGALGITERTAYSIVSDLTVAGYLVKHKDGRRSRYQIPADLPADSAGQDAVIGQVVALLIAGDGQRSRASETPD